MPALGVIGIDGALEYALLSFLGGQGAQARRREGEVDAGRGGAEGVAVLVAGAGEGDDELFGRSLRIVVGSSGEQRRRRLAELVDVADRVDLVVVGGELA